MTEPVVHRSHGSDGGGAYAINKSSPTAGDSSDSQPSLQRIPLRSVPASRTIMWPSTAHDSQRQTADPHVSQSYLRRVHQDDDKQSAPSTPTSMFSESTISGGDSSVMLKRHLRHVAHPQSLPEIIVRGVFGGAILVVLIWQLVYTESLVGITAGIRDEGPRLVQQVVCTGDIRPGRLATADPDGRGVVEGMGVHHGAHAIIGSSPAYVNAHLLPDDARNLFTAVLPLSKLQAVILSSRPQQGEVSASVVQSSPPFATLKEYTVPLQHAKVRAAAAHVQPLHDGARVVMIVFDDAEGRLGMSAIALYPDGNMAVTPSLLFDAGEGRLEVVPLYGYPLRTVVIAPTMANVPLCKYSVFESTSSNVLLHHYSHTSAHLNCERLLHALPLSSPTAASRFVVLTTEVVVLASADGTELREWDGKGLHCPEGKGMATNSDTTVIIMCSPGVVFRAEVDHSFIEVSRSATSLSSITFHDGLSHVPLVATAHPGVSEVYVVGKMVGQGGPAHGTFVLSRIGINSDGVPTVSLPLKLPASRGTPVYLHYADEWGLAVGEVNPFTRSVSMRGLRWTGGVTPVGIALGGCEAGGTTEVAVSGLVKIDGQSLLMGFRCFADLSGALTQRETESSMVHPVAHALTPSTVSVNIL